MKVMVECVLQMYVAADRSVRSHDGREIMMVWMVVAPSDDVVMPSCRKEFYLQQALKVPCMKPQLQEKSRSPISARLVTDLLQACDENHRGGYG